MRIAYVVHKLPPESLGGSEIHTWSLARAMARAGHEIWVFCPSASPRVDRSDDATVRVTGNTQIGSVKSPITAFWHTFRNGRIENAWRQFLADVQPDLVHFQHLQGVSALLPHLTGVPMVATLHDYWYLCPNGQFLLPSQEICAGAQRQKCAMCGLARAGLPQATPIAALAAMPFAYRNRIARRALEPVDLLSSPSRFLRDQYLDAGVGHEEKFIVLEHGLDRGRMAGVQNSGGNDDGGPHLVFVGSIAWQKGVHVLIQALNQLGPGIKATIYGDLTTFPRYAASLREMIARPGIDLAGRLDYAAIGDALRKADFLVVPSVWYENSPAVIQEAWAAGLPVLASNMGALPEKVTDHVTGRLFRAGDAGALAAVIQDLADHPELRERYQANITPGPTIDDQAQALAPRYRQLIDSRTR